MKKRSAFLCLLLMLLSPAGARAQGLQVRIDNGMLRLNAPGLHFLTGDILQRLHDGASAALTIQAGLTTTRYGTPQNRTTYRYLISYDLWEEKYAVTRTGAEPRSVSHLSLADAERWCLDAIALAAAGLAAEQQFWVSLDYRFDAPAAKDNRDGSRFSLGGLIEIFSQKSERDRGAGGKEVTSGPFRLSELRRTP